MAERINFIGRNKENELLEQLYHSKKAEFLALYGRRRVGKTLLIREFFKTKENIIFFNVTGQKDAKLKEQIENFFIQMNKNFLSKFQLKLAKNWNEAFETLTNFIEQTSQDKKIILFFDELPWMATRNSRLLQALEYYWNQHWSNDARIKLIVCGSSASWIIHKIIKNKGGLHNRITEKICLRVFNLLDTKKFLTDIGVKFKNNQILLIYLITGGVPYYLSKIKKSLSVTQNIEKLAFSNDAFFLEEFDNLFASLFDDYLVYIEIVKTIASKREGIGKTELLMTCGQSLLGEEGIKKLNNLEEAGFVTCFKPHSHKRQGMYYRLTDEFTSFYLKWIEPIRKTLQENSLEPGYWADIQRSAEWYNWLGYAFEGVCYKHIFAIRRKLNISPTAVANSWRYVPRKHSTEQGAQVDLLFDRKDHAITLCEIKYTQEPFVLTKEYAKVLQRKMQVFRAKTKSNKEFFMALISGNGIKPNMYSEELISGVVDLDDLFVE